MERKRRTGFEKPKLPAAVRASVAACIRDLLAKNGWTHREAEEHLDIDNSTISKLKHEEINVSVVQLLRLREHTGKTVDEILGLARPAPVAVPVQASAEVERLRGLIEEKNDKIQALLEKSLELAERCVAYRGRISELESHTRKRGV